MASQWKLALAVAAFLVATSIVTYRVVDSRTIEGQATEPRYGLHDFRDAIYYPVCAFLAGDNPYDEPDYKSKYPANDHFAPYSPLTLVVHAPFGWFDYEQAQAVYFLFCLSLTVVLAAMSLRFCGVSASVAATLGLSAVLIISRPGHMNLYNGQVACQMAIATYLALWFARTHPTLSGVGLALATLKPTYGLPLAVIMLVRGDRRAIAIGIVLATVVTGASTVRLASVDGLVPLIESVKDSYTSRDTVERKRPENSPMRLDVVAMRARLSGESPSLPERGMLAAAVLVLGGFGQWRLRRDTSAAGRLMSIAIAGPTMLLCVYHAPYDVLVLSVPLLAVLFAGQTGVMASFPRSRWLATIALAIPFANYMSSYAAAGFLGWERATIRYWSSLNGVAILVALLIFVTAAYTTTRSDGQE